MPDDSYDPFALPGEACMPGGSWHMLLNSLALHPASQAQLKRVDRENFGPNRANQSPGGV